MLLIILITGIICANTVSALDMDDKQSRVNIKTVNETDVLDIIHQDVWEDTPPKCPTGCHAVCVGYRTLTYESFEHVDHYAYDEHKQTTETYDYFGEWFLPKDIKSVILTDNHQDITGIYSKSGLAPTHLDKESDGVRAIIRLNDGRSYEVMLDKTYNLNNYAMVVHNHNIVHHEVDKVIKHVDTVHKATWKIVADHP